MSGEMRHEMESLNLDDLDVEGLERRLEMAALGAIGGCTSDGGGCTANCSSNCVGDLAWRC